MRSSAMAAITAVSAVAFMACGGDQPAQDANQALSQLTKAATEMAKQAEQMAGGAAGLAGAKDAKPVAPVSFKTLIDYLPKDLGGMKPGEPEGETTTAGQWQYSQANVRFSGGEGQSAEVGIFDYAHISMLYLPFQMALKMKVSQESTHGYSRSGDVDGFPALEEWNKDDHRSEMTVLVGDRFVVSAKMRGGEEGAARKIVDKVDLKGLAKEGH
ncbi:MAG: hypothetical protein ABI766_00380 [Gemmatimonadales bacterium]